MSTATATRFELRPLTIPETTDAADAGDFVEMARIRNLVYREISGRDDHRLPADELLPFCRSDQDERRMLWLVMSDATAVGRVGVGLPQENGSRVAFWFIELRRDVWGRGFGSAAYALVERTAHQHGRTVLQSWAEHPAAPGPRLAAPTGYEDVPVDHAARFLLHRGYTLEQIERISALELPGSQADVDRLLAQARDASGDYRVVRWFAPTPPEWADGYAWLKSRMATDAPAAGLEFDEEIWDAQRVARHDAQYVEPGRTLLVTAAEHIATGQLCAFNELAIGKDRTEATHQHDTLVLTEHRGHRLGMLVKCDALRTWRDVAPRSPRVITYNAEENRPMLAINEAIGFAPIAYEGAWKKVLENDVPSKRREVT